MDEGLIYFIISISGLILILITFQLIHHRKSIKEWWKKRQKNKNKESKEEAKEKETSEDESEKDDDDKDKHTKKEKEKQKKQKKKEEKAKKKELKNKARKLVKAGNSGGNLSYWKFILAISGSILISIIFIYLIVWAVKGIWDFNLIKYILT